LPLIHQSNNSRRKRKRGEDNNTELKDFRCTYLGIDPALSADERVGESKTHITQPKSPPELPQQAAPPTGTDLWTTGFGGTSKDHTFTQEASFETSLLCIFKSNYLSEQDANPLLNCHPLIAHLWHTIKRLKQHDFSQLREYNDQWESQKVIPKNRTINFLACLLHYDGRVGDVMRYAGNNYTGSYRNIHEKITRIRQLVDDDDLVSRYINKL
jgi:hypothetical protein